MCVGWGSFLGWGAFGIGALGWLGFCSEATGCDELAAGASVNTVLLCCAAAGRASNETIATTFLTKSLQMKAADIILLQKLHKLIQTAPLPFCHPAAEDTWNLPPRFRQDRRKATRRKRFSID